MIKLALNSDERIAIVTDLWNEDECKAQQSYVGGTGHAFSHNLQLAGFSRQECLVVPALDLGFPVKDIKELTGSKAEGIPGYPSIASGKYIKAEYAPALQAIYDKLDAFKPTVIIAMGASATWAVLKATGLKKIRGTPVEGYNGYKVLPTYSQRAINAQYKLMPVFISDLQKARKEAAFPEVRRPSRLIYIDPSYQDLLDFEQEFIESTNELSVDIETVGTQITCIGFAPSEDRALVIPFYDERKPDKNYWPTLEEELQVWEFVRRNCAKPVARFVGQNYNYDMKFLLMSYGIPSPTANHDTMLLHHAMQPEMEKGLGFLASIYTDELAWKFMRAKHTVKKED